MGNAGTLISSYSAGQAMRGLILALAALVGMAAIVWAAPAQAAPASITGKWKTGDGKAIISIYKCGDSLCAKVSKFLVKEPRGGARDTENPKKSLRNRKISDIRLLWNLKPSGKAWKGKGYSPEHGRYFNSTLQRVGNRLKVKGCVTVICQTQTWSKV